MDLCEFKGSLVHIVSSRTAGVYKDPISGVVKASTHTKAKATVLVAVLGPQARNHTCLVYLSFLLSP